MEALRELNAGEKKLTGTQGRLVTERSLSRQSARMGTRMDKTSGEQHRLGQTEKNIAHGFVSCLEKVGTVERELQLKETLGKTVQPGPGEPTVLKHRIKNFIPHGKANEDLTARDGEAHLKNTTEDENIYLGGSNCGR